MQGTDKVLPDLAGEYAVTPEQAARYQQDGHILLRGVASPTEAATCRAALADAVARYTTETRALADRDTYGKAFLQVMNLWQKDEDIRRFVLARRFGKVAADLLGADGVRLFHDQALFKEPGGGPTPWHQDQVYWPLDTDKTVTMWMPLVPVSEAVGSMTFVTGSHHQESRIVISDESEAYFDRLVAEQGLPRHTYGAPTHVRSPGAGRRDVPRRLDAPSRAGQSDQRGA